MESIDGLPATQQRSPREVPAARASSGEVQAQSLREHAALKNASITPLPPSSPLESSHSPSTLRMKVSHPSLSYQKPAPSRPLNPDRRSSTPLQPSKRAVSSPHTARPNAPLLQSRSRQSSSGLLSPSPPSASQSRSSSGTQPADMETKPLLTAESVARDHFRRELDAHAKEGGSSKTIVIIRDSCYGHRFSRPRTSKASLNTIVERPERLHACVLGASTAYVRIGGRHSGGRFPPRPDMEMPPVPFKIQKTTRSMALNNGAVTQVHGQKWMEELQVMCDSAEAKLAMNGRELVRPIGYGKDEAGKPLPKLHDGDLYLCSESLDALRGCLGGVCEAVDSVFGPSDAQRAFVCIRPPGHHCSSNFPSGFCWLNNVHVGIAHAAASHGLTHAAIIDFDLHHGDGSQAIAWQHNQKAAGAQPRHASPYSKAPIGYFSLHDINSYPCEWGDEDKIKNASLCVENAHGQSVWNVHLEPWKNHADFWRLYESRYRILLEKTRTFLLHHTQRLYDGTKGSKPKAAIFLSAGFDASEWEGAGMQRHKVNVPTDFYARFTSDVVKLAEEEGLGVDGRIISVLEGGYSDRALTSGVLGHLCGLTCDSGDRTVDESLASAMAQKVGMLQADSNDEARKGADEGTRSANPSYDPEWWLSSQLEALETFAKPTPTVQAKAQDRSAANYSSPTQASTAKIADPVREKRSMSAQLGSRMSMEPEPVPPPPDVGWVVASYGLSRLLIPTDRQTLSCRPDELNAEATKIRRERQSAGGGMASEPPSVVDQRMQLRDRKPKAPTVTELAKGAYKADRRRTIAVAGDLPDPEAPEKGGKATGVGLANNRARRRSSAGSSILSAFESMKLDDSIGPPPEADAGPKESKAASNQNGFRTATAPTQKKVRQAVTAKSEASKAKTSPKKKAAPRTLSRESTVLYSHAESDEDSPANEPVKSAPQAEDDLDAISSSVKKMKINLKVPTPEENAARQRKLAEGKDKQRQTRNPRKPPFPKAAKAAVEHTATTATEAKPSIGVDGRVPTPKPVDMISEVVRSEEQQQQQSTQTSGDASSTTDFVPAAVIAHAEAPLQATIPAPTPTVMEMAAAGPDDGAPLVVPPAGDMRISVRAELDRSSPTPRSNLETSIASERSEMSLPYHPTSAPVTVKKTKADLPKFSASSPIPFADKDVNLQPAQPAQVTKADSSNRSSQAQTTNGDAALPLSATTTISASPTSPSASPPPSAKRDPSQSLDQNSPSSIWDVPETPTIPRH